WHNISPMPMGSPCRSALPCLWATSYMSKDYSWVYASNGFRSRRVSVLRCTRTGLFILGIGSGSSNRVSVDPELEIEPERGREGLVPMRLVELRVAQSLGPKRPRNGRVPGRVCT